MKFYILIKSWAIYVKEAEFFKYQGGLVDDWGRDWIETEVNNIEEREMEEKGGICMLNENQRGFMVNIEQEVLSATKKFPSSYGAMTALTEEVGELAKALMDEGSDRVWKEAVQVAAMALRVAVEGDASLDPIREIRKSGTHPSVKETTQ